MTEWCSVWNSRLYTGYTLRELVPDVLLEMEPTERVQRVDRTLPDLANEVLAPVVAVFIEAEREGLSLSSSSWIVVGVAAPLEAGVVTSDGFDACGVDDVS